MDKLTSIANEAMRIMLEGEHIKIFGEYGDELTANEVNSQVSLELPITLNTLGEKLNSVEYAAVFDKIKVLLGTDSELD